MLATFHYIKQHRFAESLRIGRMLLGDHEDLIHKAVGWMLREVGTRDLQTDQAFLERHYRVMPRTMLRNAIQRFPESTRQRFLRGTV